MEWLIENWYLLIAAAAGIAVLIAGIITFIKLPPAVQKKNILNWLLGAVTLAEAKFGGSTGQLKLREVYDKFIQRFPLVSKLISFETFSDLVDSALETMRASLETNESLATYVNTHKE